jgi:hypothetical protein
MGIKLFLLKPNLTTISATTTATGAVASVTTNTITLKSNVYASCEFKSKTSSVRSDWVYVARGSYVYCWEIVNCTDANPSVITLNGSCTGLSIVENDVVTIKSAVSADCNWTDPITITYIELKANSYQEQDINELQITRYVNAGVVIINMKKFGDTGSIKTWYLGNLLNDQTVGTHTAYQVNHALSYAHGYWPSTSPAYSILFRYNPDGFPATAIAPGSEDKSYYKYRAGAYRQTRVLILKYSPSENFNNNLTIDQVAFEVF